MAAKWFSLTKGVRYLEHETRKHNKRPDRYYVLQYKRDGKVYNEPIGWASENVTQALCEAELAKLKENWRNGTGYQSLKEKREQNFEKQAEAKENKKKEDELTLKYIFENGYLQHQKSKGKSANSIRNEIAFMEHYLDKFFGNTSIKKIDVRMLDQFLASLNEIIGIRTKNL